MNAFFISKIWRNSFHVYEPPVNEIALSVFVYIFGLVVNHRLIDFYAGVMVGLSAYFCTYYDTLGYAMMHIACGFLQQIFLSHLYCKCAQ